MTDDAREGILAKISQSDQSYAKAMEMIGLLSASTIGFIVAFKPTEEIADPFLKASVVLLFIATLSVIFWFVGKGIQYREMAQKILTNSNGIIKTTEYWWMRLSRIISLSFFVFSYILLFIML